MQISHLRITAECKEYDNLVINDKSHIGITQILLQENLWNKYISRHAQHIIHKISVKATAGCLLYGIVISVQFHIQVSFLLYTAKIKESYYGRMWRRLQKNEQKLQISQQKTAHPLLTQQTV